MAIERKIFMLTKSDPLSWRVMPQMLIRVAKFCEQYDTESNPQILCRLISHNFVIDNPTVIICAFMEDNEVVGHLLGIIWEWCGENQLTIWQYELDRPFPLEEIQAKWNWLKQWAKKTHSVAKVKALCHTPEVEKTFRIFYGFKPKGTWLQGVC